MNTPSHLLMTAAARKALPRLHIPAGAVLIGSVAADLPLYLLSFGGYVYFHFSLGWSSSDTFSHMYDTLFYEDKIWMALHNVLHAPIVLVVGAALAWAARRASPGPSRWLLWFLMACLLHSVVDIFTHHDDGPLLLFPFDWRMRYIGPISYWDSSHYGREFARIELVLDSFFLIYLFGPKIVSRVRGRLRS